MKIDNYYINNINILFINNFVLNKFIISLIKYFFILDKIVSLYLNIQNIK